MKTLKLCINLSIIIQKFREPDPNRKLCGWAREIWSFVISLLEIYLI